jgi:Domain of unknown function (DUF397)
MTIFDMSHAAWRKSTYSGQNGNCVEVAASGPVVGVRDSKDTTGSALMLSSAEWRRFVAQVRARESATG